eukprot:719490-Hanusia_phi.AAC.7
MMLHSLPVDDNFHEYSSQSGSGSSGEIKKCISVGLSLDKKEQRKYVHQLSKGCMPGVILAEGGGRATPIDSPRKDTWRHGQALHPSNCIVECTYSKGVCAAGRVAQFDV